MFSGEPREILEWLDSCEYDYIFSSTGDAESANQKESVVSDGYAIVKYKV
jgi:hypothetical protein